MFNSRRKRMQKTIRALILITLLLVVAFPVHAAKVATLGGYNSDGNYAVEVDHLRQVRVYGGEMTKYEVATTSDTLTAEDAGTVFLMQPASGSPATMTLPSCTTDSLGASLTFLADNVEDVANYDVTPTTAKFFYINPDDADFIVYQTARAGQKSGLPSAGDMLRSQGVTRDSLTVHCLELDFWSVDNVTGTWTDAN